MATKPRTILTPGDSAAPAQPAVQVVSNTPKLTPGDSAAPAQPAVQVVSNTPKLTPEGWVVPADFGAQPKRVG